jgi:hypothetical protein
MWMTMTTILTWKSIKNMWSYWRCLIASISTAVLHAAILADWMHFSSLVLGSVFTPSLEPPFQCRQFKPSEVSIDDIGGNLNRACVY